MNLNPSLIFTILLFTSLVFLTSHFLTAYFYKKKVLSIFKTLFSVEPTLEVDKVLPQILDVVKKLLNPQRCSIMLVDNDGILKIKIGDNISPTAMREVKLNVTEGIAGKALQLAQPVVVKDISKSEFYYKFFSVEKPVRKERLVVLPLKIDDKNLGVINLHFNTNTKFPSTVFEKSLLKILANYISRIIDNCYKYFDVVSDSMTRMYNHNYILKRLEQEIELSKKFRSTLSLIMIDIDHFKQINDNYGHQAGDKVIITIAKIIKDNIRFSDIAGRYGGEEFCIILPNTKLNDAVNVAQRLKNSISNEKILVQDGQQISVTCSFGVKEYEVDETVDEFLKKTDNLLYQAKFLGRDRICY
jgi:diguanylate cyclase (GGDEF)-like protein